MRRALHRFRASKRRALAVALFFASASPFAHAELTVLIGEPFGSFGTMMPTGHASVYLDRVCADGPLRLRMCNPGEQAGVVVARNDHVGKVDWLASPIMQFLYAADTADGLLPYATPALVEQAREAYRRRYLLAVYPDDVAHKPGDREWWETVGVAYDRRLFGYRIATTRVEDEAFVAYLNALPNRHRYHLHRANCADFVADAVNFYHPGTVKVDHVADMGIMSPKHVAQSLFVWAQAHPEADLEVIEIPQIPGSLRRSRPVRGGAEMLLKTKRYVATLAIIQPEAVVALLALYLDDGRFDLGRDAVIEPPTAFESRAPTLVAGS
jgi:hypothetical protein